MDMWRQLPPPEKFLSVIGGHTASLWEWNLNYWVPVMKQHADSSWDLWELSEQVTMVKDGKLQVEQWLRHSRPLER